MTKQLDGNRDAGGSPPVFVSEIDAVLGGAGERVQRQPWEAGFGSGLASRRQVGENGNVIVLESDPGVRASTRLMGLLGADVRHADLAFAFNNRLLSLWGSEFVYLPYSVSNGCLKDAVHGLRALEILSCNVTFPHKVAIMEHLDQIGEETRRMGSVNLVVNHDGKLAGYNTDSEGFLHALSESGLAPGIGRTLIYGCGGAGRALAAALAAAGMETIWLYDIVEEKCHAVETAHSHNSRHHVLSVHRDGLAKLRPQLIVNATPLGRGEEADVSPLDDDLIDRGIADEALLFFDLNYNPPRSRFLQQAETLGIAAENGLRMMCYQAKRSIEIAAGREIPWEWYVEAIEEEGLGRHMVTASSAASGGSVREALESGSGLGIA